jgi:hypothetical protein
MLRRFLLRFGDAMLCVMYLFQRVLRLARFPCVPLRVLDQTPSRLRWWIAAKTTMFVRKVLLAVRMGPAAFLVTNRA